MKRYRVNTENGFNYYSSYKAAASACNQLRQVHPDTHIEHQNDDGEWRRLSNLPFVK